MQLNTGTLSVHASSHSTWCSLGKLTPYAHLEVMLSRCYWNGGADEPQSISWQEKLIACSNFKNLID